MCIGEVNLRGKVVETIMIRGQFCLSVVFFNDTASSTEYVIHFFGYDQELTPVRWGGRDKY